MAISGVGIIVCLMLVLGCAIPSLAKVYTVGDSSGWSLNADYTSWASDKTFKVGDTLVFNFGSSHTVDEVSSSDYSTCTVGNSIASYNSGPTTIALNTTGTHYFICGVMGHCSGGMKLAVQVTGDSAGGTAPSGTPTGGPSSGSPTGTTGSPPGPAIGASNIPVPDSSEVMPRFSVAVLGLVALLFKLML